MFDLKTLHNTFWLATEPALRQAVARLALFPACPSAREVAEARRERLEEARAAPSRALAGGGTDHLDEKAASRPIRATKGKIGVISISGPIQQRMTSELRKLGGTSTEEIGAALDALMADQGVEAIVFHVDSPGGSSYGVEELADKVHATRGKKRTYAIADSMMASAAYWIGTAAETVVVTPGGDVGSVGVYAVHVDESKALEAEGLSVTLASAGKYKAEFASTAPLSAEALARLSEMVGRTYDKFVSALSRNRGVTKDQVRKDYGQGRVLDAGEALAAGLVDRVMSFPDLLGRLMGPADGKKAAANAEVLRLRHAQAQRRAMMGGMA